LLTGLSLVKNIISNFNSCISEPPQPIRNHFMIVPTSFSHSFFYSFQIYFFCVFFLFFCFLWGTQKWITTVILSKYRAFEAQHDWISIFCLDRLDLVILTDRSFHIKIIILWISFKYVLWVKIVFVQLACKPKNKFQLKFQKVILHIVISNSK
jgi:hypothetical protein